MQYTYVLLRLLFVVVWFYLGHLQNKPSVKEECKINMGMKTNTKKHIRDQGFSLILCFVVCVPVTLD